MLLDANISPENQEILFLSLSVSSYEQICEEALDRTPEQFMEIIVGNGILNEEQAQALFEGLVGAGYFQE